MDAPFPEGMVDEIKRFLSDDHTREPGRDFYQEVFDSRLFFPLQRRNELARMMRIARSINPQVVMEIGADKGGGLYHWAKCLPSVCGLIACEIRGCPYEDFFDEAFPHVETIYLPYGSQEEVTRRGVEMFLGYMKAPIDILFIDGDKTRFVEDFDTYLGMMSPNGIVFMHDVTDREPKAAYDEVVSRGYPYEVILDVSESLEQQVADLNGIPPQTPYEAWLRHWKGSSCGVGVIRLGCKGKGG